MTINHGSNTTLLRLRVSPNARRNEVTGLTDGVVQVRVAAPPVKGRANRELIAFLSHKLGVNPSSITIAKGLTSRNKVIAVDGLSQGDVSHRLLA